MERRKHTISSSITLWGTQAAMMEWLTTTHSEILYVCGTPAPHKALQPFYTQVCLNTHSLAQKKPNNNQRLHCFGFVCLKLNQAKIGAAWIIQPANIQLWILYRLSARTAGAPGRSPSPISLLTDRVPRCGNYLVLRISRNVLIQDSVLFFFFLFSFVCP